MVETRTARFSPPSLKSEQEFIFQVNLARRQGVAVTTETKYGAGGNTQVFGLVLGAKIYCMD